MPCIIRPLQEKITETALSLMCLVDILVMDIQGNSRTVGILSILLASPYAVGELRLRFSLASLMF